MLWRPLLCSRRRPELVGLTNQQNALCSPSQDVLHCKAFNLGMHLHGALVPALLLWPRALP